MLIAHSSAASTRYKLDILRALILPAGAYLTFRYDKQYMPTQLSDRVGNNVLKGERVIISSLHDDKTAKTTAYIPVRYAEIVETRVLGTMCLLVMRLGGYAVIDNEPAWLAEIQKQASNLPAYQAGSLKGMFCEQLQTDCQTVSESEDMASWEAAIKRLQKIPTYASEPYFYCVRGVFQGSGKKYVGIKDGSFQLKTSSDYQVHLIYYAVSSLPHDYILKFESNNSLIGLVDSNTIFVDNRYDEKLIRIRSKRLDETRNVSIRIKMLDPTATTKVGAIAPSVDLQFRVAFRRAKAWGLAAAIAAGMLAENYLSALEGKHEGAIRLGVVVGMAAIALLTSLSAVFGIRKYF